MDEFAYRGRLFDFYGELLSPRQKELLEMQLERDMSLSEIAEEAGISRQGAHSAIQKALGQLEEYEQKLGLMARFDRIKRELDGLKAALGRIEEDL